MPTPEQIKAQQKKDAEANLPAVTNGKGTALAVPEGRSTVDAYLNDLASGTIVGRMMKFTKEGKFATTDDDEFISDEIDFIALADQTLIGWIKFNGEGNPPDKLMGLLYDGFVMPKRESLGDTDVATWELGLNGKPQDPWQHQRPSCSRSSRAASPDGAPLPICCSTSTAHSVRSRTLIRWSD